MFRSESSILSLISIILVVLVWVSLLLGRLYYQSFIETLGLPPSESQLPLLDYALISPNVTTLAVGLFVSVAIVTIAALSVRTSRVDSWEQKKSYAAFSLLLALWPFLFVLLNSFKPDTVASILKLVGPLVLEIFLVIYFLTFMLSLLYYALAIPSIPPIGGSSEKRSFFGLSISERLSRNVGRFSFIFLAGVLIVGVFILCVMYARAFGVTDARNVLNDAKVAKVVFESSDYNERLCDVPGDHCKLKVPFVGDRLIYFLDPIADACNGTPISEPPRLHAIPLEDVRIISYTDDTCDNEK